MDDPNPSNEESIDDLTQVLTVTARKLANMTLGRKLSGQLKRSIQDKKKVSICAACGLKGHWAGDPECEVYRQCRWQSYYIVVFYYTLKGQEQGPKRSKVARKPAM
jgi:hypothetical protein